MYKIFINEKPFIISTEDIQDKHFAKCRRITHDPSKTLDLIKECEGMKSKGIVIITDDPEFAVKDFSTHFVTISAAGGVVRNLKNELLMIKRLGKWDLPKGKIDGDETPEEAAVREVEEECGIGELTLQGALPTTYHSYKMHNHRFLKVTYWFSMTTGWQKPLIPQKEEHITHADWFDMKKPDLEKLDTYNSIRDLLMNFV